MSSTRQTIQIKPALLLCVALCCACSFGQAEDTVAEDEFRAPSRSTGAIREPDASSTTDLAQAGWWRRRRRGDEIRHKNQERGGKERGHKSRERSNKERSNKERSNKNRARSSASNGQKDEPPVWKPYFDVRTKRYYDRNSSRFGKERYYVQYKGNRRTGKTKWVKMRKVEKSNKYIQRSMQERMQKAQVARAAPGRRRREPRRRRAPRMTPTEKATAKRIYKQQFNMCDTGMCGYGCGTKKCQHRRRRQNAFQAKKSGDNTYDEKTVKNVKEVAQKKCDRQQRGYGCPYRL